PHQALPSFPTRRSSDLDRAPGALSIQEAPSPIMPDQEADTVSAQEAPEFAAAQFVRWFREVAPYVHAFRGKTFVVAFGGELVQADRKSTRLNSSHVKIS